jgi:hypothetical protein
MTDRVHSEPGRSDLVGADMLIEQIRLTSGIGPSRQLVQRTDMSGVETQADITRTSLFGC